MSYMVWLLCTIITFVSWGGVSVFYKITNKVDDYTHLKTGVLVGLMMGIHAIIYLLIKGLSVNFMDILMYFPISVLYIASMIVGYRGLKYIELSISGHSLDITDSDILKEWIQRADEISIYYHDDFTKGYEYSFLKHVYSMEELQKEKENTVISKSETNAGSFPGA